MVNQPYAKDILDFTKELDASLEKGLKLSEIKNRLKKHGRNSIDKEKAASGWLILWRQCTNIFVIILLIASVIAYFSEGIGQSLVLWVIIALNVILGFLQENKAEKTLQALKDSIKDTAKVIRDGKTIEVNAEELVPGDLVVIEAGNQVPADLRLIESHSLQVNQAILTGEAEPVSKFIHPLESETPIIEANNLLFSGTTVVAGRGKGLIYATGINCQFGQIADLVSKKRDETPLENRLKYLAKVLTVISIFLSLLLFIFGLIRGWEIGELLTLSIAILVATVPESLPTTVTLALAIGLIRMAKKKAIVRRLSSVETLGTVNIIATDKTGTLTKNELSVAKVIAAENLKSGQPSWEKVDISGNQIVSGPEEKTARELITLAALCSDAEIVGEKFLGDPTEVALVKSAKELDININQEKERFLRIAEIPFDSAAGYMATLHNKHEKKIIIAKGSFEKISTFCQLNLSQREILTELADDLASEGMRVLAVAEKNGDKLEPETLRGMKFIGLIGMIDLPSPAAAEAVRQSIAAGVKPVIITGDSTQTASYVAQTVGISISKDEVIEGSQIEKLSKAEFKEVLSRIKIFARVSPQQKIKIVEALKKAGAIVAVTGDGVNDAPALRAGHVGVAMGRGGTAVAKEAADIVLLDDNYRTIVEAIRYGRSIYQNIQKAIIFLLSGNFDELLIVAFAIIMGLPSPITAIQILWMNLITDGLPAMAFAFEPPESDIMQAGPRDNRKSAVKQLISYSLILVAISIPFEFYTYLHYIATKPQSATTVILTMMVFIELAFAVSIHTRQPFWSNIKGTLKNGYLWAAIALSAILQILFIETPLRKYLSLENLNLSDYSFVFANILVIFVLAEIVKAVYYKVIGAKNITTAPKLEAVAKEIR